MHNSNFPYGTKSFGEMNKSERHLPVRSEGLRSQCCSPWLGGGLQDTYLLGRT